MPDAFWKQFKSGTDIRGVAVEGVEGEPLTLTDEVVKRIGGGFARWLCDRCAKPPESITVSVGHDPRISAPRLNACVTGALSEAGFQVLDCGLSSTPAMFMATVDAGCDGAVQITASHHPFHRNGLKFFTRAGGLEAEDITALLDHAQSGQAPRNPGGQVVPYPFMERYAALLREQICRGVNADDYDHPLKGFAITVDAGNGAGGFYARDVLAPLGADVSSSQFLEPDGHFPNHIPNPEDKEAMRSICAAVQRAHADLGVIFDTDVDRAGCVDSAGRELGRNRLIALASVIALEHCPGGAIVTDSVTSAGLKPFIEEQLHGVHRRFKRGYKNVINEAVRMNDAGIPAPLAIETSGHAAFADNYFLDDGAYLSTRIIILMAQLRKEGKTLESLITALQEPAEAVELRFTILAPDFASYGQRVIDALYDYAASQDDFHVADDNCEGIRVSFDADHGDGWFLLRLSVHDPILPLNIESNRPGGTGLIRSRLAAFFERFSLLDASSL